MQSRCAAPPVRRSTSTLSRRGSPRSAGSSTLRFLLRAEIDAWRLTVFGDGRAIVGGTDDPAVAKSVYARYIGS